MPLQLLQQQRGKFQEYLNVLEKQQDSISSENSEALIAHTELEQQIVKNISNLQKVIVPVTKMYNASVQNSSDEKDIAVLQHELSELQTKVLRQNEKNRELLRCHITEIRSKIQNFNNPYRNAASVYARNTSSAGSMIEIQA